MAGEHSIDAEAYIATLVQERSMKLTGGLYHLTQVLMAYNTNRIEGSQLTEEQTRYLYETQTVDGVARLDDVVETTNHFRLFDVMVDQVGEPLTVDVIKDYHRLLKTGTSDANVEWFAVGDWKRKPNTVGGVGAVASTEC
jgi:Fic family protein